MCGKKKTKQQDGQRFDTDLGEYFLFVCFNKVVMSQQYFNNGVQWTYKLQHVCSITQKYGEDE